MNLLCALFALVSLCAKEQKPIAPPPNHYGAVALDSLQASGLVKLNGTTIAQLLRVEGSLISQHAHIGSIEVLGEANLTDTVIQKGGTISGYLQAHGATIQQPVTLISQKAVFISSHLKGITFCSDGGYKGKQTLELRQRTIVDGPIHFESGKGEVLLYPTAQILGPVTGGKVVRKN